MELTSVKTITIVAAQSATTIQADTITTLWKDDGKSVKAELRISDSTSAFSYGRPMNIVLWDSTTTPTYEVVGDWTEAQAQARVIEILGIS